MNNDKNIFTIGDIVEHKKWNSIGTIKSFRTLKQYIFITINWNIKNNVGDDSEASLKDLEHYIPKQPLFKTEDGVAIFEDSDCWVVTPIHYRIFKWAQTLKSVIVGEKYFSTEKAAEEYVLLNNPCLSINDIKTVYHGNIIYFKELVKSKLKT